jgi:hypothetical protein
MRRKLLALIAVLLVLTMACSFLKPKTGSETGQPPSVGEDEGEQDEGRAKPPSEDDTGGGDEGGGEDEGVSLESGALDQLDYYRSTLVMHYEKGDEPVEETVIETAHIREPRAESLSMKTNDEGFDMIQIGDKMWLLFGDQWMQTSAEEGTAMAEGFSEFLIDPDQIDDLQNSEYKMVGRENMNGIRTRHYQTKYTAPWMLAFTARSDEVDWDEGTVNFWVSDERDLPEFIVKAEYDLTGKVDDLDARFTITQNITDINEPFTIEPPSDEEVGGLPDDVPLYPGAEEVTSMGGMTVFTSSDTVEDVADYYKDALESAGWENTEEMTIATMHTSSWEKDGQTLQLTISPGDNDEGASVMILTGE